MHSENILKTRTHQEMT